jgi:hypothetical protein
MYLQCPISCCQNNSPVEMNLYVVENLINHEFHYNLLCIHGAVFGGSDHSSKDYKSLQ